MTKQRYHLKTSTGIAILTPKSTPLVSPKIASTVSNSQKQVAAIVNTVKRDVAEMALSNYVCPTCKRDDFRTKEAYNLHVAIHKGTKHICPVPSCLRYFGTKAGLTKHMNSNSHTKEEIAPFIQPQEAVVR